MIIIRLIARTLAEVDATHMPLMTLSGMVRKHESRNELI